MLDSRGQSADILFGADVTVTIVSKDKVMGSCKVVVKGAIKIDKGETYGGLAGHLLNEDDESKTSVFFVTLIAPEKQEDGTWKDGSYEYYGFTTVEGNWAAVCELSFMDKEGKMRTATFGKGFKLP